MSTSRVTGRHFELLQNFGRSNVAKRLSAKEMDQMWTAVCEAAAVTVIPRADVEAVWRNAVLGQGTRLAVEQGAVAGVLTIGVLYPASHPGAKPHLMASAAIPADQLVDEVLRLWSHSFETPEKFVEAVTGSAARAVKKRTTPPPPRRSG